MNKNVKKILYFICMFILSFTLFFNSVSVLADTLGEYWDSGGDDYEGVYATTHVSGQTFTTSVNQTLNTIDLYLWRRGVTGNIKADIYATSGGKPTGSSLATSTINATQDVVLDSDAGFQTGDYWVTFDFGGVDLVESTMYAVVANITGWSGDANTNTVRWGRDNDNDYAGGSQVAFSGGAWSIYAYDLYFRCYSSIESDIPTITAYQSISQNTAGVVVSGLLNTGSSAVTQYGIVVGSSSGNASSYDVLEAVTSGNISANTTIPMSYTIPIQYLTYGQTYYCRLEATNSYGIGYSNERFFTLNVQGITVTIEEINIVQGSTGNWTGSFLSKVVSPYVAVDNVTGRLATSLSWTNSVNLTTSVFSGGYYLFSTSGEYGNIWPLTENTTYYYQAYATSNGTNYYSQILNFTTPELGEIYTPSENLPIVTISDISDISDGYNNSYTPVIRFEGKVISDTPVVMKAFDFSLMYSGNYLLNPTGSVYFNNPLYPDKTYPVIVSFASDSLNIGFESGDTVYCQAKAKNQYGWGRSAIQEITPEFIQSISNPTTEPTTSTGITDINTAFDKAKSGLGLTGILGSWAFMFILIIATSLIFGIAYYSAQEKLVRIALSVTWILCVISIVGAFLFTSELGIFTIIIASGAVVAMILIFLSVKLSGSGNTI